LSAIITAELKSRGSGTTLHWRLKINNSLPRSIRRRLAQFVVTHLMRMEAQLSNIERLSLRALEPQSVPTAA
jgi:hypothetical protein